MSDPVEPRDVLRDVLPTMEDEDLIEYIASMLEEDSEELVDDLAGFLEEHCGDDAVAVATTIRQRVFGTSQAASSHDDDVLAKLNSTVIMAKQAEKDNAAIQSETAQVLGSTAVNYNSEINRCGNTEIVETAEEMIARAKRAKKAGRMERRAIKRERTAAPVRTAILEGLTKKPVVIHGMQGEDGSYGGNPCIDMHLRDVSIDLAGLVILDDANLTLAYGRTYGLIGRNGVGKTTFLKYLAGKAIEGIPWFLQILHIEQEIPGSDMTALETILSTDVERTELLKEKDGIENGTIDDESGERLGEIYERLEWIDADLAESRAATILAGLSFTQEMMNTPTKDFSGGWRMRISLARALFIHPDVLLLDEPTNHLDLHAVIWLENYLRSFENTVIVVSHARGFLDSVCTDIIELKDKKVKRYKGNFSTYEDTKANEIQRDAAAKEKSDKERAKLTAFINKNIGGGEKGANMAKSRQKMLAKIKVYKGVADDPSLRFKIPCPGPVAGGWGIRLVDVGFGYPDKELLFENVEFSINTNSRICLVGPNGIGKSTLLKVIYGELEPTKGMVTMNQRLRVQRFTQHHVDQMDMKRSPLEQFKKDHPEDTDQQIRKHLGNFGVVGGMQVKPINTLSGGQKSRVALAMITYSSPQLLLLDEPTNHLDLDTVQALIAALAEFEGGVLVVSHDEHLITAVCDELWIIKDKKVHLSKGDFQEYKKSVM